MAAVKPAACQILEIATGASIWTLAREWAPELDVEPRWLKDRIREVCLHGDIDEIPLASGGTTIGLICINKATKRVVWRTKGAALQKLAKHPAAIEFGRDLDLDIIELYESMEGVELGVTREAVLFLCRHVWRIDPPSFWAFPKGKASASRPSNIVAKLKAFHQDRPKETEAQARTAANEDPEIGRKFTDSDWRAAWAQRDSKTKFGRGEKSKLGRTGA